MADQVGGKDDKSDSNMPSSSILDDVMTAPINVEVLMASNKPNDVVESSRQPENTSKHPGEHSKVPQESNNRKSQVFRCCPDGFCDMVGRRKARNDELCKRELELRQRLATLECWMPAVTLLKIMTGELDSSNICDVIEKQAATMSMACASPCATRLRQPVDSRVRGVDAERKLEEARTMLQQKQLAIEERARQIGEAKRKREELEQRLGEVEERLGPDAIDLMKVASAESIASFGPDDLDYLIKLEELIKAEDCTKRQLEELERRERAYMKTLQETEQMRPKDKHHDELDKLRGQLTVKSSTNQQLATRVCELEDQVEKLKKRLANCNEHVVKLTEEQRADVGKLPGKQKTDVTVGHDTEIKIRSTQTIARPGKLTAASGSHGGIVKKSEKGVSAVVRTTSKETLSRPEFTDRAVQEIPHPDDPRDSNGKATTRRMSNAHERSPRSSRNAAEESRAEEAVAAEDQPSAWNRTAVGDDTGPPLSISHAERSQAETTASTFPSTRTTIGDETWPPGSVSDVESSQAERPNKDHTLASMEGTFGDSTRTLPDTQNFAEESQVERSQVENDRQSRSMQSSGHTTVDNSRASRPQAVNDKTFVSLRSGGGTTQSSEATEDTTADEPQARRSRPEDSHQFQTLKSKEDSQLSEWQPSLSRSHGQEPREFRPIDDEQQFVSLRSRVSDVTYTHQDEARQRPGTIVDDTTHDNSDMIVLSRRELETWQRNVEYIRRTISRCVRCNARSPLIVQLGEAMSQHLGIPFVPLDIDHEDAPAAAQERGEDRIQREEPAGIIEKEVPAQRGRLEEPARIIEREVPAERDRLEQSSAAEQASRTIPSMEATLGESQGVSNSTLGPDESIVHDEQATHTIPSTQTTRGDSQWPPASTLSIIDEDDGELPSRYEKLSAPVGTSTPERRRLEEQHAEQESRDRSAPSANEMSTPQRLPFQDASLSVDSLQRSQSVEQRNEQATYTIPSTETTPGDSQLPPASTLTIIDEDDGELPSRYEKLSPPVGTSTPGRRRLEEQHAEQESRDQSAPSATGMSTLQRLPFQDASLSVDSRQRRQSVGQRQVSPSARGSPSPDAAARIGTPPPYRDAPLSEETPSAPPKYSSTPKERPSLSREATAPDESFDTTAYHEPLRANIIPGRPVGTSASGRRQQAEQHQVFRTSRRLQSPEITVDEQESTRETTADDHLLSRTFPSRTVGTSTFERSQQTEQHQVSRSSRGPQSPEITVDEQESTRETTAYTDLPSHTFPEMPSGPPKHSSTPKQRQSLSREATAPEESFDTTAYHEPPRAIIIPGRPVGTSTPGHRQQAGHQVSPTARGPQSRETTVDEQESTREATAYADLPSRTSPGRTVHTSTFQRSQPAERHQVSPTSREPQSQATTTDEGISSVETTASTESALSTTISGRPRAATPDSGRPASTRQEIPSEQRRRHSQEASTFRDGESLDETCYLVPRWRETGSQRPEDIRLGKRTDDKSRTMHLDTMTRREVPRPRPAELPAGSTVLVLSDDHSHQSQVTLGSLVSVPPIPVDEGNFEGVDDVMRRRKATPQREESKRVPRGREDGTRKIDERRKQDSRMEEERRKGIKEKQEKGSQVHSGGMTEQEERKSPERKRMMTDKESREPASHTQEDNKSLSGIPKLPCCICHAARRFRSPIKVTRTEYERSRAAEEGYSPRDCLIQSPRTSRHQSIEIKSREHKTKRSRSKDVATTTTTSVETQSHVRRHEVTVRHNLADYSCEVCDCDPCGTEPSAGNSVRADASTNLPSRPPKKSQGVLAKITRTNG